MVSCGRHTLHLPLGHSSKKLAGTKRTSSPETGPQQPNFYNYPPEVHAVLVLLLQLRCVLISTDIQCPRVLSFFFLHARVPTVDIILPTQIVSPTRFGAASLRRKFAEKSRLVGAAMFIARRRFTTRVAAFNHRRKDRSTEYTIAVAAIFVCYTFSRKLPFSRGSDSIFATSGVCNDPEE